MLLHSRYSGYRVRLSPTSGADSWYPPFSNDRDDQTWVITEVNIRSAVWGSNENIWFWRYWTFIKVFRPFPHPAHPHQHKAASVHSKSKTCLHILLCSPVKFLVWDDICDHNSSLRVSISLQQHLVCKGVSCSPVSSLKPPSQAVKGPYPAEHCCSPAGFSERCLPPPPEKKTTSMVVN